MSNPNLYIWWGLALALIALAMTIYIFKRRKFEKGYKKGVAANPAKVRRENQSVGAVKKSRLSSR